MNKETDVLVVRLHGALDRRKYTLPRFERMRTIISNDVSSMYFADPALTREENIQLAWYTGWDRFDAQQSVADWSVTAAKYIGPPGSGPPAAASRPCRSPRLSRAACACPSTHRHPSSVT